MGLWLMAYGLCMEAKRLSTISTENSFGLILVISLLEIDLFPKPMISEYRTA